MNLKNKKMFGRILILIKLGQTIMYRYIARAHYSELIPYCSYSYSYIDQHHNTTHSTAISVPKRTNRKR